MEHPAVFFPGVRPVSICTRQVFAGISYTPG